MLPGKAMMKNTIPTYDFCKTLEGGRHFEFSKLEESYTPYDAAAPHRHNYYEVLYFKESGGWHEIDFNSFPVQGSTLHFISPEQVHLLRREARVTGFVLSFSREFFFGDPSGTGFIDSLPFFDNPGVQPLLLVGDAALATEMDQLLLKIQDEYASGHDDSGEMLRIYLTALLIHARRMYIPHTGNGISLPPRSELTRRFKELVEEKFRQHKSVAAYAGMLNITAGHLSDTIQKDTGRTASEIIQQRVVLEAKRLLFHSSKSVKEIAFELQYEDPSYFSRFFKAHAELTPEQFRSDIREKYH